MTNQTKTGRNVEIAGSTVEETLDLLETISWYMPRLKYLVREVGTIEDIDRVNSLIPLVRKSIDEMQSADNREDLHRWYNKTQLTTK